MYRKILIPTQTQLLIDLPEEFIGHQVELIAFTTDEAEKRKYTLEENEKFYSQFFIHVIIFIKINYSTATPDFIYRIY